MCETVQTLVCILVSLGHIIIPFFSPTCLTSTSVIKILSPSRTQISLPLLLLVNVQPDNDALLMTHLGPAGPSNTALTTAYIIVFI